MKLVVPERYKLYGRWRKVMLVPHYARDNKTMGTYNPQTGDIELDDSLSPAVSFETFIHEVQEGANIELELQLEHPDIQRLGRFWGTFLMENKDKIVRENGTKS